MIGPHVGDKPTDTPEERTKLIFEKVDTNNDGKISLQEFMTGCVDDPNLATLLSNTIPPDEDP